MSRLGLNEVHNWKQICKHF